MTLSEIKQPLVSVIMPTYNHAQFIGEAIDSVLNQTYKNIELIIIDNYSEDNTEEIIRSFNDPRIKYMKFRNHGIIGASRNQGIRQASGKYIAFLDSDDLWVLKKLEEQVLYMEYNPDIALVFGRGQYVMNTASIKNRFIDLPYNDFSKVTFEKLFLKNLIPSVTVMILRSIIDRVGLFDESPNLVTLEDYDLWLRIAYFSEIRFSQKILVGHRVHSANSSSQARIERINKYQTLINKYLELGWIGDKLARRVKSLTLLRIGKELADADDKRYRLFFLNAWKEYKSIASLICAFLSVAPYSVGKASFKFLKEIKYYINVAYMISQNIDFRSKL